MRADLTQESWPAEGLESLGYCPLCGCSDRSLLHDNLTDRVFRVAPGKWQLWSCFGCEAAYLDPRPDRTTIGLAYSSYYTHAEPKRAEAVTLVQRFRHAMGNAYRNNRFGTKGRPAIPLGHLIVRLLPEARRQDTTYRFLPRPTSKRQRLLDVGCGNGDFLQFAKQAGWETCGVEPDGQARQAASAIGADVRPRLEDWSSEEASFDYITANHVIEHVHDPHSFLRRIFALLRPGAGLFLETPNIKSMGYALFKESWRDLDPPRHLVLFDRKTLESTVRASGFTEVIFHPRPEVYEEISSQSARIARGLDPFSTISVDTPGVPRDFANADLEIEHAEFLTATARRP